MGMTLVHGYLALKYLPDKEMTLREFTKSVALAMCAMVVEGNDMSVAASTRGSRQAAIDAHVAKGDPGDLPHALFNGRALGLGGTVGEGRCRVCLNKHASGVCKTCSRALDTDHLKPCWVCYPEKHGRQCYCQHLAVDAKL